MHSSKSRLFVVLAAWMLVVFGVIAIAIVVIRLYRPELIAGLESGDYFEVLLFRTVGNTYQLVLLSGWIALFLHGLWFYGRGRANRISPEDYRQFTFEAQTLFTSLGFLGTIVGISLAVAGLGPAMTSGNEVPTELIDGLSVAFDTTFLGLGAAITLIVLRQIMPHREVQRNAKDMQDDGAG